MSRKHNTRPARPHWERVTQKRANGVQVVQVPDYDPLGYGFVKVEKRRTKQK